MRILLVINFYLISTFSISAQDIHYIDFNSDLIMMRDHILHERWDQAISETDLLSQKWNSIRKELNTLHPTSTTTQISSAHLNPNNLKSKNQALALSDIDDIINAMHHIRVQTQRPLPFDVLWKSYRAYDLLNETVNDQMMNLYDWFEFEDQFNDFLCKWDDYEVVSKRDLKKYYPTFNYDKKEELIVTMNVCIDDFLQSTESGYRPDFILPCDRMGQVINESLLLFAIKSKESL
jgi:hypothetical protein